MNEFKNISCIKYCHIMDTQCNFSATYQRIFQCGGSPNQGKLVNFKCSHSTGCSPKQCPIYMSTPQIIEW